MKPRWMFVILLAAVVVVNLRINKYQTEIDTSLIAADSSLIAVIDTLHAQIDSLKTITANTGAIVCDYAVLKIPDEEGRER